MMTKGMKDMSDTRGRRTYGRSKKAENVNGLPAGDDSFKVIRIMAVMVGILFVLVLTMFIAMRASLSKQGMQMLPDGPSDDETKYVKADVKRTAEPTEAPKETPTKAPEETTVPTEAPSVESSPTQYIQVPREQTVEFTASGDNLIHSYIYNQAAVRGKKSGKKYDFSYCYDAVADYFKDKDLNWINQETLVSDTLAPDAYPSFSTPAEIARELMRDNFTVFNTSSNHTYDRVETGLNATMKFWNSDFVKKHKAVQCGIVKKSDPDPFVEKTVNGIRIGFLAYTYGTNSIPEPSGKYKVLTFDKALIKKQMKSARKKCDILVVSCHWGDEYSLKTNAMQKDYAKYLTKLGADLIIGTHPHVVQDAGWVKAGGRKAFVAYSLGNFFSGQAETKTVLGLTLSCKFHMTANYRGERTYSVIEPKLIPVITVYGHDHTNERVMWLAEYTEAMAKEHGVNSYVNDFSKKKCLEILKNTVNNKYIQMSPYGA